MNTHSHSMLPNSAILTPFLADVIALLGAAGVLLTAVALLITIAQLIRTTNAVDAASKATQVAVKDSRSRYLDYILSNTRLIVRDLEHAVHDKIWQRGSLRASDLADHLVQILRVLSLSQDADLKMISDLRDWSRTFQRLGHKEIEWTDSLDRKWTIQVRKCYAVVDSNFGPFKNEDDGHE